MKLGIDFINGVTVITPDWETMVQYVNGGDVTMVIVCASGEILFDARDGWDIVTQSKALLVVRMHKQIYSNGGK